MPKRPHQLEKVSQAVTSTLWAILPEKLEEICAFLNQRANGEFLSEKEIQAAIGRGDEDDSEVQTVEGVRILTLRGTVMPRSTLLSRFSGGVSCEMVSRQIERAIADTAVKSILIRGDSPGGSVFGVAELATTIYEARAKKPIYFWTDNGQCCSAMYWIGSACTKVFASEGSEIGSIGVIAVHQEITKMAEEAGVKFTVLRSVENKAVGQPYEVLDEKKRAVLMEKINTWHAAFVEAVGRNRGIDASTINEKFGAGKTFRAEQAADLGLIDGVQTFSQVFESLRTSGGGSGVSTTVAKEVRMNERVKAALVAEELIPMSATDQEADSALNMFFKIKGVQKPEAVQELVDAIRMKAGSDNAVSTSEPLKEKAPDSPQKPEANGADAAQKAERERWSELGATGRMMGVDHESILEAQENGLSIESAVKQWRKQLAGDNQSVDPHAIKQTGSSYDAFVAGAADGILQLLGGLGGDEKPSEHAKDFHGKSMVEIASTGLRLANVRIGAGSSNEDICEQFLKLSGQENMPLVASEGGGSPTYGPGHYPDLMSNVANRLLNRGQELAPATFPEWTATMPDVSDFRPRTIINTGAFGLFSHILDGKEIPESDFATEANFISVKRFGDKVSLTPILMANDDLDAWSQAMMMMGTTGRLTINAQCVSLLYSTSPLPDGIPLFHANHGNIVSDGGGAPSITQADKNRKLMRAQKEVSNKLRLRVQPSIALVPTTHETTAEQVFLPRPAEVAEQASNVNTFRGKVKPICEPMLDDYDPNKWFGFADPRLYRSIVVMHLRGMRNGKRRRYWKNETQSMVTEYEIAFGVGVADFRNAVQNPGQ